MKNRRFTQGDLTLLVRKFMTSQNQEDSLWITDLLTNAISGIFILFLLSAALQSSLIWATKNPQMSEKEESGSLILVQSADDQPIFGLKGGESVFRVGGSETNRGAQFDWGANYAIFVSDGVLDSNSIVEVRPNRDVELRVAVYSGNTDEVEYLVPSVQKLGWTKIWPNTLQDEIQK